MLGKAITYAAPATNFNQFLAALYAHFNGVDTTWQIKAGVTLPTTVTTTGDQGFVVEDVATQAINVAFAYGGVAGLGGVMVDAGAPLSGDGVIIGLDTSGGITDITSVGFTVGAGWGGWAAQGSAVANTSHAGRAKVSSGVDASSSLPWLFVRVKSTGGLGYRGGMRAGAYQRLDATLGDGQCLFGGLWSDWANYNANDHGRVEPFAGGTLDHCRVIPDDTFGMTSGLASDGAGLFRTTGAALVVPSTIPASTLNRWTVIGTLPELFIVGGGGTVAKAWEDGVPTTVGYCMAGGSWVARDDQGDAE